MALGGEKGHVWRGPKPILSFPRGEGGERSSVVVLIPTGGFVCHCLFHYLGLEEKKLWREQWGGVGHVSGDFAYNHPLLYVAVINIVGVTAFVSLSHCFFQKTAVAPCNHCLFSLSFSRRSWRREVTAWGPTEFKPQHQPMNCLFTLDFNWPRQICTPLDDKIIITIDIQRMTICIFNLEEHLESQKRNTGWIAMLHTLL